MSKPPGSFNGTENLIQNYCVTFSHNFGHYLTGSRPFRNSFVIKGAEVTKENALKIAEILFPDYTEKQIESIENDENTLTPSEYDFIQGVLKDKMKSDWANQRERISKGIQLAPYEETDYDRYLVMLIKKMQSRMNQFPVYHT